MDGSASSAGRARPPLAHRHRAPHSRARRGWRHRRLPGAHQPPRNGLGMTVHIFISLQNQTEQRLEAFEAAVAASPSVIGCDLMSGEDDYLLTVLARDLADYERIHKQELSALRRHAAAVELRPARGEGPPDSRPAPSGHKKPRQQFPRGSPEQRQPADGPACCVAQARPQIITSNLHVFGAFAGESVTYLSAIRAITTFVRRRS